MAYIFSYDSYKSKIVVSSGLGEESYAFDDCFNVLFVPWDELKEDLEYFI